MRSSSTPNHRSAPDIDGIDAEFRQAGLVRNLRGHAGGVTRRVRQIRLERATPEELSKPAPTSRVAPNGVHWLSASGWERTRWLWHGFSTRKGGESRVYARDDAPGELNLGFTAADNPETVASNRRLWAEAITGDQATPLITLRQIHSNVVVRPELRMRAAKGPAKPGSPATGLRRWGAKAMA